MHSTSRGLRTRLCDALGTRPLLTVAEMAVLGANIDLATEWERQRMTQLGLYVRSSQDLADAPEAVTRDATHWLPAGESAVHIDVDVNDFTDAPLSENTESHNSCTNRGCSPSVLKPDTQRGHTRLFLGSSLLLLMTPRIPRRAAVLRPACRSAGRLTVSAVAAFALRCLQHGLE